MSTRSYIAKEIGEDKYKAVYCLFDGYPAHHGRILVQYYDTPEKVDTLLTLGGLSALGEKIAPDADFVPSVEQRFQENTTVAYARDCGEPSMPAEYLNLAQLVDNGEKLFADHLYVFTKDNAWKYLHLLGQSKTLQDLKSHPDVSYTVEQQQAESGKQVDDTIDESEKDNPLPTNHFILNQ